MVESDLERRLTLAIRTGDREAIESLLDIDPSLANARLGVDVGRVRTPLHVVTDWPGYFPNGPAIVELLVQRGADPNAKVSNARCVETPLHWAASSDDVDVAAALIDGGADLETPGGSIGSPLDNAIGYGCWQVARLLAERGANVDKLWHAAALGMLERVMALLDEGDGDDIDELNGAFWYACAGGQRRAAELLLGRGADVNAIPEHATQSALDQAGTIETRREALVAWLRDQGARSTTNNPPPQPLHLVRDPPKDD